MIWSSSQWYEISIQLKIQILSLIVAFLLSHESVFNLYICQSVTHIGDVIFVGYYLLLNINCTSTRAIYILWINVIVMSCKVQVCKYNNLPNVVYGQLPCIQNFSKLSFCLPLDNFILDTHYFNFVCTSFLSLSFFFLSDKFHFLWKFVRYVSCLYILSYLFYHKLSKIFQHFLQQTI